ncbi:MAG: hypothetical protein WD076_08000, partial [Parvularculaceae bacterium]
MKHGEVVSGRAAMKRHRLFGALILFLTATLALWPIVVGDGRRAPAAAERGSFGPAAFADTTETIWDCEQFGGFAGMRANGRARVCGPGKLHHAKTRRPAQKFGPVGGGPLDEAVVASIAGGEAGLTSLLEVPPPDDALGS